MTFAFVPVFGVGPMELCVVAAIALFLFGKRLPSVARSLGSSIVEFKKGFRGIEDEANSIRDDLQQAANDINRELRK